MKSTSWAEEWELLSGSCCFAFIASFKRKTFLNAAAFNRRVFITKESFSLFLLSFFFASKSARSFTKSFCVIQFSYNFINFFFFAAAFVSGSFFFHSFIQHKSSCLWSSAFETFQYNWPPNSPNIAKMLASGKEFARVRSTEEVEITLSAAH